MGLVVLLVGQSSGWLSILLALWIKSFIILATAALLTSILRDASARLRHILWCAALSSLLVLPLFSGGLQPLHVPILPAGLFPNEITTSQTLQNAARELPRQTSAAFAPDLGSQAGQSAESDLLLVDNGRPRSGFSWQAIILLVWILGVVLVMGRFLVGKVTVRHLVSRATELTGASWSGLSSELSQELRLKRGARLLRSHESVMPMTCGGLSAVVLLPNEADRWPADRRRVVVLHELIHIKRRDLQAQAIAQVVCALYWFNPLVWWAVDRLRREQEWACDEHVVASGVAASDYAMHLFEIARKFNADALSAVATTAMARPSQLHERLCAILKPAHERYRSGRVIAVSFFVLGTVFISAAVTKLVTAHRKGATNVVSNDAMWMDRSDAMLMGQNAETRLQARKLVAAARMARDPEHDPAPQQTSKSTPVDQPVEPLPAVAEPVDQQVEEQSFAGYSAEERDRLASQGIGLAYIKEMADAGYNRLTVDQLIQLFSNSVRAEYVAGLRSVGYDQVWTRDLLSLKTNGITPEVIKSYQAVKHASFEAKKYVALVSNGVTPSYLKSLADAGYDSLSANKAIELRLAGVTSDFIAEVRSRGYVDLSPNELIELKRREKY
jgi:beta-lactamase regulating signal transducer with metallopeptidase domain